MLQLEQHQAAGPVDIGNAFLEDKQWDMEAMVISTIAGQLEDEEEEEDVPELLDGVEEGDCDACDEDGSSGGKDAFGGWALVGLSAHFANFFTENSLNPPETKISRKFP